MLKLFNQKRQILKSFSLCLSFLLLTLFLFWPSSSLAFVQYIVNAITFVPYLIISLILIVLIKITQAFAWLAGWVLDLVSSPTLITLSYTKPTDNPVIKAGLNITQNFVNILLVVALVYTALSLALRINETAAKKTLVRLIIVALLANFSPVLCGLVVDATNIAMYYFLEPLREGISGVLTQLGSSIDIILSSISGFERELPTKMGVLMMAFTQIMVNVAMGVAFLIFALILLVRYIAIWALVVLSPLAFAAWALPKEKPAEAWEFLDLFLLPLRLFREFWDLWLRQFIEWSIIGIPMAFFLYLGISSFSLMTAAFKFKLQMPGIERTATPILNDMFPYFVVILFLYFGFTIALKTSAMGAAKAIDVGKKAGIWGTAAVGRLTRRGTSAVLEAKGKEWLERQAATPLSKPFGESKIGKAAAVAGWAIGATPTFWAIRRGIGEAGLRLTETERKEMRRAEERYKNTIPERKLAGLRDAMRMGDFKTAAGILRQGIEEGQIGDLKKAGLTEQEIIKLGQSTLKTHPEEFKKIRDAFPQLAKEMVKGFPEEIQRDAGLHTGDALKAGYSSAVEKIIAQLTPEKIQKVDPSIFKVSSDGMLENKEVERGMHKFWTGPQIREAARTFGKSFVESFNKTVQAQGRTWYEKENPGLLKYLDHGAAQALGLKPPQKEESPEIIIARG